MGTRIAASDLTWLLMDRPNNLMHVHGLMTFDELPEWDALRSAIFDRVVTKYRVLSQIPVKRRGHWEWVDDPDFSIDRHVLRVVLPDGDPETLRSYVASQFSVPFDRTRPLWDMQLISGPEQDRGGAMLSRFHHGLGDGIRLVQLLLGTCDPAPDATPKKVGRSAEPGTGGPLSAVLHFAEHSIKDSIDALAHSGDLVVQAGRAVVATMNPLELPHHLETATEYLRHPTRIIDALTEYLPPFTASASVGLPFTGFTRSSLADAGSTVVSPVKMCETSASKRQCSPAWKLPPRPTMTLSMSMVTADT